MRVMIRMFTTTYGESETCTPMWAIGEPTGPMLKGITYIVRPFIEPSNFGVRMAFILSGAIQLLVGPASSLFFEQMYVRSSTRATSLGWLRARKQFGPQLRVEPDERAGRDHLVAQPVVLLLRAVAPVDLVGLAELAISSTQRFRPSCCTYSGLPCPSS